MIKHVFFFLNSHGLLCVSYSFLLFGRKCLGTPLQNFYKPRWFQQKNISFLVLVLTIFSKPLLIKSKLWNGLFAVQKHVSVDFSSNVTEHLFPLHSNSNDISKGRKKKKEEKSVPNRDVVSLSSENGEPLRDHRNGHGKLCLCFENNLAFHPPNLIPVRVNASPMKYKQTVMCNPKQTPVPYTYLHVSKHHC